MIRVFAVGLPGGFRAQRLGWGLAFVRRWLCLAIAGVAIYLTSLRRHPGGPQYTATSVRTSSGSPPEGRPVWG